MENALPIVLVALNIWTQSHVSCLAKQKEEEYTGAKINSEMHCTHHTKGVFVYALQLCVVATELNLPHQTSAKKILRSYIAFVINFQSALLFIFPKNDGQKLHKAILLI